MTDESQDGEARAHHLYDEGKAAYDRGDLQAALDAWTEAMGIMEAGGDTQKAHDLGLDCMAALLRLGGTDGLAQAGAYHLSADEVWHQRQTLAVQHLLGEADSLQQYVYGRDAFQAGDMETAVQWWELAIGDPSLPTAYVGNLHHDLGVAYLDYGGTNWETHARTHLAAGGMGERDIEDLVQSYQATGRVGGEGQGLFQEGLIAYQAEDWSRAAELWSRSVAAGDTPAEHREQIHWYLACAYVRIGDRNQASDAAKLGGHAESDLDAEWARVHGAPAQ